LKDITIAVDAMGGDHGPKVIVAAVVKAVHQHPDLNFILVGDEAVLTKRLKRRHRQLLPRIRIQHASELVGMDELPSQALRYKKDSSMRVAINLVKSGEANAAVSAGNTGALMATARFVLKTLPGIDRPAIMAHIPSDNPHGFVRMLDLGANVDSTPEQLFQFAVMGSVVAHAVSGIDAPRVALLNIGEEEMKGNEQVKQTAELLASHKAINYVGNAEGSDIFADVADVIVCDGFVGNVALKTIEGAAKLIAKIFKQALLRNWMSKCIALISKPILQPVIKRMDTSKYNGASLLGLKGIVVKSHGSANIKGWLAAINHAYEEVERDVLHLIEAKVSESIGKNNE